MLWVASSREVAGQISPGPLARPHARLEGALQCTKCHGGGKQAMSGNCLSCHRDIQWLTQQSRGYHATAEVKGQTCAACHPDHAGVDFQLIKWPDGSRERFNHRRAGWSLAQSHGEQECAGCHTEKFRVSPAAALVAGPAADRYTGLETGCASCHDDIHRGSLGTECSKCHDAGKWSVTPGFDHDSTSYPLTNRHVSVACDKCHAAKPASRIIAAFSPVAHQSCADCHSDPHAGRLGSTCTSCHTTTGFKVIDKQRFNHDRTRYALRGRHVEVRCAGCHQDFASPAAKKPSFQRCGSCHRDAHNGTATLAGQAVDCAECHGVEGFAEASFTLERHRRTRYPLDGKHQTVACRSCHDRDSSPGAATTLGSSRVRLHPRFSRCLDCHQDQHGGQLAAQADRGECGACHKVAGWSPSTLDATRHANLKLPLEGRHRETACRSCHATDRSGLPALPRTITAGKAGFVFHVAEVECAACHADPHLGRFTAQSKALACTSCHDTRAFRPSTVDVAAHRSYRFPLEGAHRATPCVGCHADLKTRPASRTWLVATRIAPSSMGFSASIACRDCHNTPHGNQFGGRPDKGRCDVCHGVDAFAPAARFDHDRDAGFALKGAHQGVPCNRCHPSDPTTPGGLIYRPVSGKCENCHAGKEAR